MGLGYMSDAENAAGVQLSSSVGAGDDVGH